MITMMIDAGDDDDDDDNDDDDIGGISFIIKYVCMQ